MVKEVMEVLKSRLTQEGLWCPMDTEGAVARILAEMELNGMGVFVPFPVPSPLPVPSPFPVPSSFPIPSSLHTLFFHASSLSTGLMPL